MEWMLVRLREGESEMRRIVMKSGTEIFRERVVGMDKLTSWKINVRLNLLRRRGSETGRGGGGGGEGDAAIVGRWRWW